MSGNSRFVTSLRHFLADLSFEIFLYVGLISAVLIWWQTGSVYAAIAGFVVVIAILGAVAYQLIDAKQVEARKRSWLPLFGFVGVLAVGTLLAYLWQYFA
jgi:peptidoglycan/LPS O-acetylase OafA/YrhL